MAAILVSSKHRSCVNRSCVKGFTILEVLFALLIVSIGLLGLAMMQGTTIQANGSSNRISTATILAQDKLESFNQTASLSSGMGNETVDKDGTIGKGIFTRSWTVAEHTTFSKLATVTVSWLDEQIGAAATDDEPTNHSVVLRTITQGGQN